LNAKERGQAPQRGKRTQRQGDRYTIRVQRTLVFEAEYEVSALSESDAIEMARELDQAADLDAGRCTHVERSVTVKY
jgi:hypothetical protein